MGVYVCADVQPHTPVSVYVGGVATVCVHVLHI